MKVKLFLDEDVHAGLTHTLHQRGFDVVHAQEMKRKGRSDADQLAFAVQEKRCLVAFNIRDFVLLHNSYLKQDKEHWGIIASKQMSIGEILRRLLFKLAFKETGYFKNRIEFL